MQKTARVIVYLNKHYVAKNCLLLTTFTRDSQRMVYIKIATVLVAFFRYSKEHFFHWDGNAMVQDRCVAVEQNFFSEYMNGH